MTARSSHASRDAIIRFRDETFLPASRFENASLERVYQAYRGSDSLERNTCQNQKTKNQAQIEQAWAIKTGDQTLQLLHDFTLNNALSPLVQLIDPGYDDLTRWTQDFMRHRRPNSRSISEDAIAIFPQYLNVGFYDQQITQTKNDK